MTTPQDKPTREQLKERLREKIELKQEQRMNMLKHKVKRDRKYNLIKEVELMMKWVSTPQNAKLSLPAKIVRCKKMFPRLFSEHAQIAKAIIHGEMSIPMLKMMLRQRDLIASRQKTQDEVDKRLGYLLFNKYKIDEEKKQEE